MQINKKWLLEFNAIGLQLRPNAAKLATSFLSSCDNPTGMAEALAEHTKVFLKNKSLNTGTVIDVDIMQSVIGFMSDAQEEEKNGSTMDREERAAAVRQGIQLSDLGDGITVYNALTDVQPFEYKRATREWVPAHLGRQLFPQPNAKAKIYADRYHILWSRLLLGGIFVPEAEAVDITLLANQRVLTPVESLVGNPGQKLTFGLLTQLHDEKVRRWAIEDLHQSFPIELEVKESEVLMTNGSFVLAQGQLVDGVFRVRHLEVPDCVSREFSDNKDNFPHQAFGGNMSLEQLQMLQQNEVNQPDGMYCVLCEVHLDSFRTLEKLSDLFEGYEEAGPPKVYVFMGSFCSKKFLPTAEGVKSYREGFERLKFMLRKLPNHMQAGTRYVFVPGPNDPGPQTLPRPPLPGYLTAGLADDIPCVVLASNPCRIRHLGKEMVFFRHDILRLLRRHEAVPLRMKDGSAPTRQHLREEMVRLLMDQAHLVPLPLEESNILWSFDHSLRLYPLPHSVFVGGVTEPFDTVNQGCRFCSVGPFHRDASFYSYYPVKGELEPCDIPDAAG